MICLTGRSYPRERDLYRQRDELLAQNERLLADIERWNATIAAGAAKAEQMEAVIQAARGVANCLGSSLTDMVWEHASGGACLNLLDEALAAYDANPVPLPTTFVTPKDG